MNHPEVEIIAIGNELLLGDVQDTNTHWLCRQITELGGRVQRAAMIRDEVQGIAGEIRAALSRRPALLILSGGLGPTDDDLTLQALAEATQRRLEIHPDALEMVALSYETIARAGFVASGELTESRKKMATLPEGSEPLHNPVGAAPGVLLKSEPTSIVALPGVPQELKGIFETSLSSLLRSIFGSAVIRQRIVTVNCGDESALTEALRNAVDKHPRVYIKSRARKYGDDVRLNITLHASGNDSDEAESLLDAATNELTAQLSARGIDIHSIQ